MTKFKRKFNMDAIEEVVDAPENAWFRDLLSHWRPAGDRDGRCESQVEADHLRLTVRNGYLNFYRAGQSVAKVSIIEGTRRLQATIHKKYVFGENAPGRDYILVSEGGFAKPDGSRVRYCEEFLLDWTRAASQKKYAKEEKQFVDRLVTENPGVIDLEAGLPWDPDIWTKKSARRIDVVALDTLGDRYKLVFWEAKLVTNSEARSKTAPKVIEQLKRYQRWLAKYQNDVREAYQTTCAVLARMHAIARARNLNACELGSAVGVVARQDPSQLGLDERPRLIIDDTEENACFMENGHLDKLREVGIAVQLVRGATGMSLSATA
ncbi:MAG: hypothetical protein ABSH50_33320 [Bryobacteraceae bacterium]|jgi:hypothetical protein